MNVEENEDRVPYGERVVREGGGARVPETHVENGSKQDLRAGVYPISHVTTQSIAVPRITHLFNHRMTAECIYIPAQNTPKAHPPHRNINDPRRIRLRS